MKRLAVWLLTIAWLGVTTLQAQEPKLEQPGSPPQLGLLAEVNVDSGDVAIWFVTTNTVNETEVQQDIVDGKPVMRTVIVPKQVQEHRMRKLNLRDVQVLTPANKRLTTDQALARLKRGQMLFFHSGDKLDERYLKVMKEDALIVLIPVAGP